MDMVHLNQEIKAEIREMAKHGNAHGLVLITWPAMPNSEREAIRVHLDVATHLMQEDDSKPGYLEFDVNFDENLHETVIEIAIQAVKKEEAC